MSQCGFIEGMQFPELPPRTKEEQEKWANEKRTNDFYDFAVAVLTEGDWEDEVYEQKVRKEKQVIINSQEFAAVWSLADSLHMAQVKWLREYMKKL